MSKLIKVRQVIKLSGWVNGSGWIYNNSVYDDQIIDIDENDLENMDWDWWELDKENPPGDESDTEITVEFYAEDADTSEDKPLASHSIWESEIWKDRHNNISAAAAALGRKGGSVKSEAKARAVRENGKKGGRPKMYKQNEMLKIVGVMTMEELDQIGHWNGEYYTVDGMTITPQYKQIGEDEFELTGYKIDK